MCVCVCDRVCPTQPHQPEICLATKTGCAVVRFEACLARPTLFATRQVPIPVGILRLHKPRTITLSVFSVNQKRLMWNCVEDSRELN